MNYRTLMVHLDIGAGNDARLAIASDLAQRFDAHLIGVAAAGLLSPIYFDAPIPGEVVEADRVELGKALDAQRDRFWTAVKDREAHCEWRQAFAPTTPFVTREARAADLVVVGADRGVGGIFEETRLLIPADFVMSVGRPVLVVPPEPAELRAERALVAWKDTREARRAVWDALPLLKLAGRVIVAEIDDEDLTAARARVADVAAWLRRHGVIAESTVAPAFGDGAAQLDLMASEEGADLIVAGAYGHSRLREYILGGVTRDLLRRVPHCSLLSH